MAGYDLAWKVIMVGDNDASKTSLLIRYTSKPILEDLKMTTGADIYSKDTKYDRHKIRLQLWDFGDEERFRFLLPQYCNGANGAIFLYNITKRSSLHNLPKWNQIIRKHAGNIPILLVGTEAHLEEKRAVTREQGFQTAREYNLSGFIEVSSKTGQNVEHLFETMAENICRHYGC